MDMQSPSAKIDRKPTDPPTAPMKVEMLRWRVLSGENEDIVSDEYDDSERWGKEKASDEGLAK